WIDGITVLSHSNGNNDGIDLDGTPHVTVINSFFDTGDDAIVLKSLTGRDVRDVVIRNNTIRGDKSAVKTGTESVGGFKNIRIEDLDIVTTRGINIYSVDGGDVDSVWIRDIRMDSTYAVLTLRNGSRLRPYYEGRVKAEAPGTFNNIWVDGITATNVSASNDFISGIPGYPIRNVELKNISIDYPGGGTESESALLPPEKEGSYPKEGMFGVLPSYGFFIRHTEQIAFENTNLTVRQPDARQAIVQF
ncbi:MAG: hypothetical protein AAFW89_11185, partial [Bacteroidota bacterium]